MFKSPSSSSASPSTPSDYGKSRLPFSGSRKIVAEPAMAYANSRYSRTCTRTEPSPFSTSFGQRDLSEDSLREASIRDALAYGDGQARRTGTDTPNGTFHLARSADGEVEVLQKEHAAS